MTRTTVETPRFRRAQRLSARGYLGTRTGIDMDFALEYMGSAEFEWGAVPESLARIRQNRRRLTVEAAPIESPSGDVRHVWMIADRRRMDDIWPAFAAWVAQGCPGKEHARFVEQFPAEHDARYDKTIAWWDLEADVAWALDAQTARLLLAGFAETPRPRRSR